MSYIIAYLNRFVTRSNNGPANEFSRNVKYTKCFYANQLIFLKILIVWTLFCFGIIPQIINGDVPRIRILPRNFGIRTWKQLNIILHYGCSFLRKFSHQYLERVGDMTVDLRLCCRRLRDNSEIKWYLLSL